MSATGLQINWSSVTYTRSNNAATTITKVDGISLGTNNQWVNYKGGTDVYNTTKALVASDPKFTVKTSNIGVAIGLVGATGGTFTATHNDALGASGGGITYTLANATVEDATPDGNHAQYGSCVLMVTAVSSDGQTNPLSYVRV